MYVAEFPSHKWTGHRWPQNFPDTASTNGRSEWGSHPDTTRGAPVWTNPSGQQKLPRIFVILMGNIGTSSIYRGL